MKKLVLVLSFLFITNALWALQTSVNNDDRDTLTYHRFKPCDFWTYVNDFDSGINGYVCNWSPLFDVEVPDAHSLLIIINKMQEKINLLEKEVNALKEKQSSDEDTQ